MGAIVSRVAAVLLTVAALAVHQPGVAACSLGRVARLPVTMDGMRPNVPVTINGKPTRFLLDSGAFFSFMSKAKAAELGLTTKALPNEMFVTGLGGTADVKVAIVKSFGIAGASLNNIEFLVGGSDIGSGLIGLNLLASFDTDYDLANGTVDLMRAKGCGDANLAHWAGDKTVSLIELLSGRDSNDNHIYASALINGKPMRATFDTGAMVSVLTRSAAEKAGIDLSAPDARRSADVYGVGREGRASWIVKLASFSIGGEEIRNTPIRVISVPAGEVSADVVLGADFFLAHHIFVVRSQRRIYMTYNGGPVFSLTTGGDSDKSVTRAENMGGDDATAAPTDATGFARRGAARTARGDYTGGIADLSEAIRLDPKTADHYRARARAYAASGNAAAARQDMDAAIAVSPADAQMLVARGLRRSDEHDAAGALADAEAAALLIPAGSLDNHGLIMLFEQLHQPQRSITLLDAMIASHRQDFALGSLLNSRCWARGLANVELDKALADCNDAIRRDGPKSNYLDSRGFIHLRQKDYVAAIADYDAALKANPDNTTALFMRGWARRGLGETELGNADIAAAKKAKPDIVERFGPYGFGD